MSKDARFLCTGGSGFIGTHFMEHLLNDGATVLNLDTSPPLMDMHRASWQPVSILDAGELMRTFRDFAPTHVLHLAARASMVGDSLDDFRENTDGTRNVLNSVADCGSVSRLIVASSQHVRKPGAPPPVDDLDFDPYKLYGESKVITEKLTHESGLECIWTIIRPTAIWGPRHPFHVDGLWRVMKNGQYLHPRTKPVLRSFGFVGNTVHQILTIFSAEKALVDNRVFYIGDPVVDQTVWLNAFSEAITGRPVRTVPWPWIRALALVGDLLKGMKLPFPIFSSRYRNLTTSNPVPVDKFHDLFGTGPYTLQEGVDITVQWLDGCKNG